MAQQQGREAEADLIGWVRSCEDRLGNAHGRMTENEFPGSDRMGIWSPEVDRAVWGRVKVDDPGSGAMSATGVSGARAGR